MTNSMHSSTPNGERLSLAWTLWLMPVILAVHDGEELATMPGWIARHQRELAQLAGMNKLLAGIVHSLATTTPQMAIAVGFILVIFVAVTAGASLSLRRGPWLYAYSCLLGVLFLHVFTHVGQAILMRGYTPGVVGAVLVIVPGALFIYRRLFAAQLLTWKSAVVTALAGLALFIPGVLMAHGLGRWMGKG
ncbi:MAG: HXXEE domain-containing protein [Terriglobia bacterium]